MGLLTKGVSCMQLKNKNKVIFIMGATATGKSRLSIELANRFPAQIVNSDKIQVYKGLDIVTNKVTELEMQGVPHHLIGVVGDPDFDYTAHLFCNEAMSVINKIVYDAGQVPIVVGGSNSFIETLVDDSSVKFKSKYDCCFIWVDVSPPVLCEYIAKRVDLMLDAGLLEEVRGMYSPEADYSRGIRRAIGVPELDEYFRTEKTMPDEKSRESLLASAVHEIKANTCNLARRQVGKIRRLKEECGWLIHRIDATTVFEAQSKEEMEFAWKDSVLRPCMEKVMEFLYD